MILDPVKHARMIAEADSICLTANIPKHYFLNVLAADVCGKDSPEVEWVKHYYANRAEARSLLLTGIHKIAPDTKMMAMAGGMLRNNIDARVIPLHSLLDSHKSGEAPDPTVLLVPNLFVQSGGKGLTSWQSQMVYDLLLSRFTAGKLTVAYVQSLDGLAKEYGILFSQHLKTHYTEIEGDA